MVRLFGFILKRAPLPKEKKDDDDIGNTFAIMERLQRQRIKAAQLSMQERMLKLEDAKLQAELNDLADEYAENDDKNDGFNPDEMLGQLAMKLLNRSPAVAPINTTQPGPSMREYSDEELSALKGNVPRDTLKLARSLPDEKIAAYIRQQVPDMAENSVSRAIKLIKE